jgi:rhodanese-related sulfurtransferase
MTPTPATPRVPAEVAHLPLAEPESAVRHFAERLRFSTDASDVHAAMQSADPGFVLVDTRGQAAWDQGHLPGALHLPTGLIPTRAAELVPAGSAVVTYCWGPGCNGAMKAALAFARLGYEVREMLGGYEYWVREGLPVRSAAGLITRPPDPVTAVTCDC